MRVIVRGLNLQKTPSLFKSFYKHQFWTRGRHDHNTPISRGSQAGLQLWRPYWTNPRWSPSGVGRCHNLRTKVVQPWMTPLFCFCFEYGESISGVILMFWSELHMIISHLRHLLMTLVLRSSSYLHFENYTRQWCQTQDVHVPVENRIRLDSKIICSSWFQWKLVNPLKLFNHSHAIQTS